jgi:hypothetical protein
MRTTIVLDEDVSNGVKKLLKNTTLKDLINSLLRQALAEGRVNPKEPKFKITPHKMGLLSGYDVSKFNQLSGELEIDGFVKKLKK